MRAAIFYYFFLEFRRNYLGLRHRHGNLSLGLVHLGQKEYFALLFMPDYGEYFASRDQE